MIPRVLGELQQYIQPPDSREIEQGCHYGLRSEFACDGIAEHSKDVSPYIVFVLIIRVRSQSFQRVSRIDSFKLTKIAVYAAAHSKFDAHLANGNKILPNSYGYAYYVLVSALQLFIS